MIHNQRKEVKKARDTKDCFVPWEGGRELSLSLDPWWRLSLTLDSLMETEFGSLTPGWDSPLTDHRLNTDSDLIFDSCQLLSKTENLATAWPLMFDPRQLLGAGHSFCLHVFVFQEQIMQFCAQAPARPLSKVSVNVPITSKLLTLEATRSAY